MSTKSQVPQTNLSFRDCVLRPPFKLIVVLLSSFVVRLVLTLSLLPAYMIVKMAPLVPRAICRSVLLLSKSGRDELISSSDSYRHLENRRAAAQLKGEFEFQEAELLPSREARGTIDALSWRCEKDIFNICGAQVNIFHKQPGESHSHLGKKILLLHGNPSWSFMWRNVIEHLVEGGHEVFAIDWIGHGASDKPLDVALIPFELHMRTLKSCIDHFELTGCYIVAHDWGGCVALCTLPLLPAGTCSGIFLLNTFFPPRPSDISLYYYLLYLTWFFSTGIFGGYIPESMVMRFMCPEATSEVISGYSAPYAAGAHSKASVGRFAHIVPGIPDLLLGLRRAVWWRVIEGVLGPENFTNINAQARLAGLNVSVRKWWSPEDIDCKNTLPRVSIAFGQEDPLLKDFKGVLERTLGLDVGGPPMRGTWISGAGHYPVEEKPQTVAQLILRFLDE